MIVSDTGPLAVLFKARLLFILKEVDKEILVPGAVERELKRKPEGALIFRGTLGLFVEAKKKGIIKSVHECINELLEVGYYLDVELIEEVLRKTDEIQNG